LAEIRLKIDKIEATKLSQVTTMDSEAVYKVNVSLAERERTAGRLVLNFTLEVGGQPDVAKIVISGFAEIEAQREEIQAMLKSEDSRLPPPILAKIYERLYGTLYLLCDTLRVPHPLPTLLRVQQGAAAPKMEPKQETPKREAKAEPKPA
jgi:hypothetical protein